MNQWLPVISPALCNTGNTILKALRSSAYLCFKRIGSRSEEISSAPVATFMYAEYRCDASVHLPSGPRFQNWCFSVVLKVLRNPAVIHWGAKDYFLLLSLLEGKI